MPTRELADFTGLDLAGPAEAACIDVEVVGPLEWKSGLEKLLPLGIEKGKEFKPDATTQSALAQSARDAHAWLIPRADDPRWPTAGARTTPWVPTGWRYGFPPIRRAGDAKQKHALRH